MAVVRDILEAIHQRRGGPNPGSDFFSTINSYALQPGENAASIVDYSYLPGCVDRYGVNAKSGTTDTTAFWNAAAAFCKNTGHDLTYGATWPYLTTGPINITCDAGADFYGFNVRCTGQAAANSTNAPGYPSIIANHTGHVFDCAGATAMNWTNVSVGTLTAGSSPKSCWFLARNSSGGSQIHRFRNCRAIGKFSSAVVYDYGSEDDQYDSCVFYNYSTTPGAKVGIWTSSNVSALSSTFITIATGNRPTTAHYINGGVWINAGGAASSDVIYLDGATSFNIDSPFMLCTDGVANRGRSLIFCDTTNGPTNLVHLKGIQSEFGSFTSQYGVYIGDAGTTVSDWRIDGCNLSAGTSKIFSNTGVVLDSFHLCGLYSSGGSANVNILGTLQNSDIQEYATNIAIATSKDNNLFVSIANLTVTTRVGDNWLGPDRSLTWTPNTSGFTVGGTLTVSNKTVHYHGRQVTVICTLSPSTTLSCPLNTAMTGLPVPVAIGSGIVTVVNSTTNAQIGLGYVTGTTIKLPAISVTTNDVSIVATYFVST